MVNVMLITALMTVWNGLCLAGIGVIIKSVGIETTTIGCCTHHWINLVSSSQLTNIILLGEHKWDQTVHIKLEQ